MKHISALTYEPKVFDVRNGICIQTIRPKSETRPKNIGDYIMFHGWEGKPYHSKWSWRTPYWEIIETFFIKFMKITSNDTVALLKYYSSIKPFSDEINNWYRLDFDQMNDIAILDGFKAFEQMATILQEMYGSEMFNEVFQAIRWDFKKEQKTNLIQKIRNFTN